MLGGLMMLLNGGNPFYSFRFLKKNIKKEVAQVVPIFKDT